MIPRLHKQLFVGILTLSLFATPLYVHATTSEKTFGQSLKCFFTSIVFFMDTPEYCLELPQSTVASAPAQTVTPAPYGERTVQTTNTVIERVIVEKEPTVTYIKGDTMVSNGISREELQSSLFGLKKEILSMMPASTVTYLPSGTAPAYSVQYDTASKGYVDDQITAVSTQINALVLNASSSWQQNGSALYYTGGNVGIGTSIPGVTFEVNKDLGTSTGQRELFKLLNNGIAGIGLGYRADGTSAIGGYIRSTGSLPLYFDTSSTPQAMTLLNSGHFGIGTTTPSARLSVTGFGGTTQVTFRTANSSNVPTFSILDNGNVGIGSSTPSAKLTVAGDIRIDDTISRGLKLMRSGIAIGDITTANSRLTIQDRAGAGVEFTSSSSVSLMMLTGTGNLGIGTTTPSATLTASGTIRFISLGSAGANLITDSLGNVTVSSDERLKDIQNNFSSGLEQILKIQPIAYKWKEGTGYDTTNTYAGFSAQNIQGAIPEAVSTDNRGYLTLADRPILATLVNAVKELATTISGYSEYFKSKHIESDLVDSKKVQTETLCVKKSSGAEICLTGDQLEAIMSGQTAPVYIAPSTPINPTPEPEPEVVEPETLPEPTTEVTPVPEEVVPPTE